MPPLPYDRSVQSRGWSTTFPASRLRGVVAGTDAPAGGAAFCGPSSQMIARAAAAMGIQSLWQHDSRGGLDREDSAGFLESARL
jgi:hypothetical protein